VVFRFFDTTRIGKKREGRWFCLKIVCFPRKEARSKKQEPRKPYKEQRTFNTAQAATYNLQPTT